MQASLIERGILHVIPSAGRRSGGLGPVTLGLSLAQRSSGIPATIWSTDDSRTVDEIRHDYQTPADLVTAYPTVGPSNLYYSPQMEEEAINGGGERFAVMHLHGVWTAISRVLTRWQTRYTRPAIIAPHGALDAWALRRSRFKKAVAFWTYQAMAFRHAACLHALSEMEMYGFRRFGLKNPIAVIPNGVSNSWRASSGDAIRFCEHYSIPTGKRLMLYLSRVTPKKGLPLLLEAMARSRHLLKDEWSLVIAGPDEFGHLQQLLHQADALGIGDMISYVGPLFGQDKRDAYAAADFFVLPSYSEGAPLAVLEALGVGLPVLTTTAVPLPEIVPLQCGWQVEASSSAITEALQEALQVSPRTLTTMGDNGRRLVAGHYTWEVAARKTLALYRWLLGEADRPYFVSVD